MKNEINWGIIGLGKIAHKFAQGLNAVENGKLYAVASRNIEKATEFASEYNAKTGYGSYEELMKDNKVDAIYIATPHVFHHQLTLECIKKGKAVLCEKPFAMNTQEAKEMIDLARSNKVFLMEALWTRFLPHFKFVLETINSGKYGKVKALKADFGFTAKFDKTKRLFNKDLGGGSLLDIGIYPIFLAYSILGKPLSMEADAKFAETGVDNNCKIKFTYPEDIKAELFSTLVEDTPTTAEIILEKGTIFLNSRFHEPTSITITTNGKAEFKEFGVTSNGYNFEAEHVSKMLQESKIESDTWPLEKSLELMELLDEVREKIGLKY